MEHQNIMTQSYLIPLSGYVLSTEEKSGIHTSLLIVKNNYKFYRVVFWGKIFGIKNDYHIAQGYRGSVLGERISLYSIDGGITWNQLSNQLKSDDTPYLNSLKSPFIGDPGHYYVFERIQAATAEETTVKPTDAKGDEKKKDNDDDDDDVDADDDTAADQPDKTDEEKELEKRKKLEETWYRVQEEARLAHFIKSLDHDTSVCPRGVFMLNAVEDVVPNQVFSGLDKHSAGKLRNYIHLREPEKLPLKTLLEMEHLSKTLDFADTIDEDVPNRCWSLQYEEFYSVVVGRSLLWPGYVFYHVPNTTIWGSFYFGNGVKNTDLCFML